MKIVGKDCQHLEQFYKTVPIDAGIDVFNVAVGAADITAPNTAWNIGWSFIRVARCLRQFALEVIVTANGNLIRLFAGDATQLQQMFEISFSDRLALLDRTVHLRLREERLVAFVMT